MKVSACLQSNFAGSVSSNFKTLRNNGTRLKTSNVTMDAIDNANKFSSVLLSFTGATGRNMSQLASISSEYQGTLDSVYKVGGEGNVAGEAAVAMQKHGKMDFRTFVPYYSPDNKVPDDKIGHIKVRKPIWDYQNNKQQTWKIKKFVDGKEVVDEIPAYEFVSEKMDYQLKKGENFVIHEPVQAGKEWQTGYQILEDTGIKGEVKAIGPKLEAAESVPYKVFKIQSTGVNVKGRPTVYVVHTPELATLPKAYGGDAYAGKMFDDYLYSIFSKASVNAIEQMNNDKFGNFNPGNLWLHDRQAFPAIMEISERSSLGNRIWDGVKAHTTLHNPGRDYQGHYVNPIDFFRITGSERDLIELKKNPDDFAFVKQMINKIDLVRGMGDKEKFAPEKILTKEELERLHEIFKPLYGDFRDELGEYNMCKIPVVAIRKNPYNFSTGTVSRTYGKEMKNPHTKEIAYGLTSDFASVPTIDVVNGSTPKSLQLDEIGSFGANNGFTESAKTGFTPLTKEIMTDKDKLFNAKQANKKWVLDTVAEASSDPDKLAKLFFNDEQIKNNSTVLGQLGKYNEGDILLIGWGRADTQKGFPTTIEAFLEYFKNPNIPTETKKHVKALIGAGPWKAEASDWQSIQKFMKEIQELEGGAYKDNVCYLNGRFSNRIVACADYSIITSRYEPCGITPLESYAAGTPVISNNTGGSPDFIKPYVKDTKVTSETGFLTKHAFLVNPDVIGASEGLSKKELDDARILALGKENSECIEQAMDLFTNKPDEYKKMMSNALSSKIDWHENAKFNQGKSALKLYKENVWGIDANNNIIQGKERNFEPLNNLKGTIKSDMPQNIEEISNVVQEPAKTGIFTKIKEFASNNKYLSALVAVVCLAGIIYAVKRGNKG